MEIKRKKKVPIAFLIQINFRLLLICVTGDENIMIFNNSIQRSRDHFTKVILICANDQLERENLNNHFNQLLQW